MKQVFVVTADLTRDKRGRIIGIYDTNSLALDKLKWLKCNGSFLEDYVIVPYELKSP